jgi:hypothetical protein
MSQKINWLVLEFGLAVLLTAVFSFEPLITLVLATKNLPQTTSASLFKTSRGSGETLVNEILNQIPETNKDLVSIAESLDALGAKNSYYSAIIQPKSLIISTTQDIQPLVGAFRRYLAKKTPFAIKTVLPDSTTMTEIVIDPSLVPVETKADSINGSWTFTQTNPQLTLANIGSNKSIIFNNPQVVYNLRYKSLNSCSETGSGIKVLTYQNSDEMLSTAIINSFLAYLKDYSCFQSFSTFSR